MVWTVCCSFRPPTSIIGHLVLTIFLRESVVVWRSRRVCYGCIPARLRHCGEAARRYGIMGINRLGLIGWAALVPKQKRQETFVLKSAAGDRNVMTCMCTGRALFAMSSQRRAAVEVKIPLDDFRSCCRKAIHYEGMSTSHQPCLLPLSGVIPDNIRPWRFRIFPAIR
ncbi:hypothetical protein BDZ97DRAFT_144636 [Flammula alnicola]|nr:hypothetical protein BDZ97DRAFT_144636 [Flammula alnicola]